MKLVSLALATLFSVSVFAADTIPKNDIDPDVLESLYTKSELIQCDAQSCWNRLTDEDAYRVLDGSGFVIIYRDIDIDKDELERYTPFVTSYYETLLEMSAK